VLKGEEGVWKYVSSQAFPELLSFTVQAANIGVAKRGTMCQDAT